MLRYHLRERNNSSGGPALYCTCLPYVKSFPTTATSFLKQRRRQVDMTTNLSFQLKNILSFFNHMLPFLSFLNLCEPENYNFITMNCNLILFKPPAFLPFMQAWTNSKILKSLLRRDRRRLCLGFVELAGLFALDPYTMREVLCVRDGRATPRV